jgi:hypothetical protein
VTQIIVKQWVAALRGPLNNYQFSKMARSVKADISQCSAVRN